MELLKQIIKQKQESTSKQSDKPVKSLQSLQSLESLQSLQSPTTPCQAPDSPPQLSEKQNPSKKLPAGPLNDDEVIFRLRKLGQPARLFGESAAGRVHRLLQSEEKFILIKKGKVEDELNLERIDELFSADRGIYTDSKFLQMARECQACEDQGKVWKKEKWKHPFVEEAEELDFASKALVVCLFWQEALAAWQAALSSEQQSLFASTLSLFKRLVQSLRLQSLHDQVINLFFICCRFCQLRSYSRAYDTHLLVSSLTSFHKNTHTAGAMNSDIGFRKITQALKRLITISEKLLPAP